MYVSRQPLLSFAKLAPRSLARPVSFQLSVFLSLSDTLSWWCFCGAKQCDSLHFLFVIAEVKGEVHLRPVATPVRSEKPAEPVRSNQPSPASTKGAVPKVPDCTKSARPSRSSAYFESPTQLSSTRDTPTPHTQASSIRPSPRPSVAPTTPASCRSGTVAATSTSSSPEAGKPAAVKGKSGPKPTTQPTGPSKHQIEPDKDSESELEDNELSECAMYHKLRRICVRKPSGKLLVPKEVHEAYKRGGEDRKALEKQLVECGFDKAESSILSSLDSICQGSCTYTL